MQREIIEKLGRKAIVAGIDPLKRERLSEAPVVGFDTEYNSKTRKLICYQLAGERGAGVYLGKLTPEILATKCREVAGPSATYWLVTFWSYAELQFLPVVSKSFGWNLYGAGSFDCAFSVSGVELRIFDLARFFERQSLARVAESFGLKKLDYDVSQVTRAALRDPRFLEYARNDAVITREIIEKLRAEFLPLGADPLESKTAAGTSAAVFRGRYVHKKLRCTIPKARLAGLYSCWGGRAEVFRRGRFPRVIEYDLESAYPRAAVTIGRFPTGGDLFEADLKTLEKLPGFARVIFRHPPDTAYPALPVIEGGSQLYPLEGTSWASSYEIRRALELGASVEVLEGWAYRGGSTALADFMLWALETRKGAQGAKSTAYKLMANSLIGKLAQRRAGVDIEKLRQFCEDEAVSIYDAIRLNGEELKTLGLAREAKVGTCFMPEWNSLITGYTRARLNEILYLADPPVYCATDSVWSLRPIVKPPPDLGLKREGRGIVVRTRLGGIFAPGARPHLAHHSIHTRAAGERLLRGLGKIDRIRYRSRRAIKLRESLRRRLRLGTFLSELREGSTAWDGKRRLESSGATVAWRSVSDYLLWKKQWLEEQSRPALRKKY